MSYHVYTTAGIILEGKPRGDADKYYSIFTKDLGVVIATAKSVRKPASKLRFALDDFSYAELSFIRGKREWKITHARAFHNIFRALQSHKEKRDSAVRIARLLKTLVIGEGAQHDLYTAVSDAFTFLISARLSKEEIIIFERIITLRILALLGYGTYGETYASFVDTAVWSDRIIRDAIPHLDRMTKDINSALEATELSSLVY